MTAALLLAAQLGCLSVSADDLPGRYVREFNAADDELYTNAVDNASAEAFLRRA